VNKTTGIVWKMDKKRIDRRVERTRQLLRDALVSLILEKGYQKITVQDIIDRANVGRSTFYSHYQDKEDLLFSGFDELAFDLDRHRRLPDETGGDQEHLLHSLEFFIHANDNRELYMAMSESGGGEQLLEIGRQHMQNHIEAHLVQFPSIGREFPLPVITNFLAGSLLTMILWWLEQEAPYTPQEMDDMFNTLAMPGIRSLMKVYPSPDEKGS
jgi:AcrR family transcriptional regulator